jgi:hypothetical protein
MKRLWVAAIPSLVLGVGCSRESRPQTSIPQNVNAAPRATPVEALDAMDTRTPVPLLPMMANHQKQNMREHLVAVHEIVTALATDDFAEVERAAGRIGFSEQMGQMCTHMGAGAPGFTEQALAFHRTADRIGAAAKQRDRAQVLAFLGETLKTCTACHATWKQQVVDDETWQRLTSVVPTPPSHR